jgi:hypothetical protein
MVMEHLHAMHTRMDAVGAAPSGTLRDHPVAIHTGSTATLAAPLYMNYGAECQLCQDAVGAAPPGTLRDHPVAIHTGSTATLAATLYMNDGAESR